MGNPKGGDSYDYSTPSIEYIKGSLYVYRAEHRDLVKKIKEVNERIKYAEGYIKNEERKVT